MRIGLTAQNATYIGAKTLI